MKHIPTLTLTALAAAASAQTAPAAAPAAAAKQELSYNRVVVSAVSESGAAGLEGVAVFGQAKLGNGFYVAGTVFNLDNSVVELTDVEDDTYEFDSDNSGSDVVLGYAYSLGSVAGIAADLNIELGQDSYGLGVRALIATGLELGLAYTNADSEQQDVYTVSANYSLSQFVKGLSLNVSHADQRGDVETTLLGLGYNF
jgi:hypothetical protein